MHAPLRISVIMGLRPLSTAVCCPSSVRHLKLLCLPRADQRANNASHVHVDPLRASATASLSVPGSCSAASRSVPGSCSAAKAYNQSAEAGNRQGLEQVQSQVSPFQCDGRRIREEAKSAVQMQLSRNPSTQREVSPRRGLIHV